MAIHQPRYRRTLRMLERRDIDSDVQPRENREDRKAWQKLLWLACLVVVFLPCLLPLSRACCFPSNLHPSLTPYISTFYSDAFTFDKTHAVRIAQTAFLGRTDWREAVTTVSRLFSRPITTIYKPFCITTARQSHNGTPESDTSESPPEPEVTSLTNTVTSLIAAYSDLLARYDDWHTSSLGGETTDGSSTLLDDPKRLLLLLPALNHFDKHCKTTTTHAAAAAKKSLFKPLCVSASAHANHIATAAEDLRVARDVFVAGFRARAKHAVDTMLLFSSSSSRGNPNTTCRRDSSSSSSRKDHEGIHESAKSAWHRAAVDILVSSFAPRAGQWPSLHDELVFMRVALEEFSKAMEQFDFEEVQSELSGSSGDKTSTRQWQQQSDGQGCWVTRLVDLIRGSGVSDTAEMERRKAESATRQLMSARDWAVQAVPVLKSLVNEIDEVQRCWAALCQELDELQENDFQSIEWREWSLFGSMLSGGKGARIVTVWELPGPDELAHAVREGVTRLGNGSKVSSSTINIAKVAL